MAECRNLQRADAVSADVGDARARLLGKGPEVAGPQLRSLDFSPEDANAVAFEVDVKGDFVSFTAFIADDYPSGPTTVYGPDSFELELRGGLGEVLEVVLEHLRARHVQTDGALQVSTGGCEAEFLQSLQESSPRDGEALDSDPEFELEDEDDEDYSTVIEEARKEPRLAEDLAASKALLGGDAVSATMLSAEGWRVRLRVNVTDSSRAPIVDQTAAKAWGLDPYLPLTVELNLPMTGYLEARAPHSIRAVSQEGFPDFKLEKQLVHILDDFCAATRSVSQGHGNLTSGRSCSSKLIALDPEEAEVIETYQAKKASLASKARGESQGLLCKVARYLQLRLPTVHEYCAICDEPFAIGPMFMRAVCCNELCTYQFSSFGDKITTAEGVNTKAEIVDLLVVMLMKASQSDRRELILDPYPCVHGGRDGTELFFSPKDKDFSKLSKCVEGLRQIRDQHSHTVGASWSTMTSLMEPEAMGLIKWLMSSNRSYLAVLSDDERITAFPTPFQYLLISAPPEKEKAFQELKKTHGSTFAYHGSPAENWHSILRHGLKNASNTKFMTHGAAHGPGIYLATDSATSIGYAMRQTVKPSEAPRGDAPAFKRSRIGNRVVEHAENMVMLAVCEVVDHNVKKCNNIWVASQEETVCTRFFLVFTGGAAPPNVQIKTLEPQIRACMEKLGVGVSRS